MPLRKTFSPGSQIYIKKELSKIQAGKRPKKRKSESYDHYIGRVGIWLAGQEPKPPKKAKTKTERQKMAEERKKTEKMLGIKRGVKKKTKKKK